MNTNKIDCAVNILAAQYQTNEMPIRESKNKLICTYDTIPWRLAAGRIGEF